MAEADVRVLVDHAPQPAPSAEARRLLGGLVWQKPEEKAALSAYIAGLEAALAPFAALAGEGRRTAYTGQGNHTSEGRPFDESTDDALVQIYVTAGDIRAAALAYLGVAL